VRVIRLESVTTHTGSISCESHTPKNCYYSHRKKMEVNWDRLDPRLQCVDGLDDIMRFDLQHFCRRMQPPEEPHYRSAQHSSMSHLVLDRVVRCHATSRHVMSCHVMSCHVMSCHVMSCHVMSCHVMSCHVMSCNILLLLLHVMSSRKHIPLASQPLHVLLCLNSLPVCTWHT